jgi:hypothetical protein
MADPIVVSPSRGGSQELNQHWTRQHVEAALHGLQFGTVTLLVQDGVVVHVERTERRRSQRYSRSTRRPN